MFSIRNQIIDFIEQGVIPTEKISKALSISKVSPDGQSWLKFINQLLLWLGGLALAFSVLFFMAYNWNDLGRFAKFAMVELFIIVSIFAYWKNSDHKVIGKVSLLVASILLGVLLALYGQTYQTGADTWQLFFNWALLIIPWAVIARFSAIWILWLVLINLSIVFYHLTFRSLLWALLDFDIGLYWLIFIINIVALIVWEYSARSWEWLAERWAVRLIGVTAGVAITWLVLYSIFEFDESTILPVLVWVSWLAITYFIYRKHVRDLFMLAGSCLTGIIVVITFMAYFLLKNSTDAMSFLILFIVVIGLGTGAAFWLRNIHREWQS